MIGANAETLGQNLFLCQECADSLFESMLGSVVGKRVLDRLAVAPAPVAVVPATVPEQSQETRSAEPMRVLPKDIDLICPKCGKGPFKNRSGLILHMRVHEHAK